MRFVTFVPRTPADAATAPAGSPSPRIGFIQSQTAGLDGGQRASDRVVDIGHPAVLAQLALPPADRPLSVRMLLEQGLDRWVERLASLPPFHAPAAGSPADADAPALPLAAVHLLAPVTPGKVVGAAFNFTDALAERGTPAPPEPVIFVRSGSTVIGPDEAIALPPDVGNVTYEAELAVVIGRRALAVDKADAMNHVAGYTVHNDVSASELVRRDQGNFVRGKNLPRSAPLGPWLVSADEVTDPYDIGIRLELDGRRLQDGSTRQMLHDIATLISYVSHRMPLDPGDVIATGTPAGVAAAHDPPAWLRPGNQVVIRLSHIGELANPVVTGAPFLA